MVLEKIAEVAALSWQTVGALSTATPRPTIVYNEELPPAAFVQRTVLLADHVLVPDRLFGLLGGEPTRRRVREASLEELEHAALLASGHVIPIPAGAALAEAAAEADEVTASDLANQAIVEFVQSQLVLEGPTAREALLVNAKDDFSYGPHFWFFSRIDRDTLTSDGRFEGSMLQSYDPDFDYGPWIEQVRSDAIGRYVQRTAHRLAVADALAADYVAASPFEARMLARRSLPLPKNVAAASVWADVPTLRGLNANDLVRLLSQDEAVEDLRYQVRLAVAEAPDLAAQADAIADITADIDHASKVLERRMRTERTYSGIAPLLLSGAGLVVGSAGGLPGLASAVIGGLAGLVPYVGARRNTRRDAAYLFVQSRRRRR
ncbi:hypothetical protein ACFUTX_11945 [Microbacterium sp. NPDC057407]|uniref:hypothetical protein n=1 Tax=Microbacterium sp. NPDC057407 TaxID=3346120 RepID=UPI00367018B3